MAASGGPAAGYGTQSAGHSLHSGTVSPLHGGRGKTLAHYALKQSIRC